MGNRYMRVMGLLFLCSCIATSGPLLTFEGISNATLVDDFYNGGAGGSLGITFNFRFQALVASTAGGTGNFSGEPSPSTAALVTPGSGSSAVLSIPAGFDTSFSLFYSGPGNTIVFFDAVNAGGSQLGLFTLPATASSSAFQQQTFSFSGTARSVLFGFVDFVPQQTFIDNLQFGPAVPEPSTAFLMAAGFAGVCCLRFRRRSRN